MAERLPEAPGLRLAMLEMRRRHGPIADRPADSSRGAQILALLREQGPHGATDEEMRDALYLGYGAQRTPRVDLVYRGLVRDSGLRRRNRSGRTATVWVAVTDA
jgi:hypothetical protein